MVTLSASPGNLGITALLFLQLNVKVLTWARGEFPDRAFPYSPTSQQRSPCSRGRARGSGLRARAGVLQLTSASQQHQPCAERCCLCLHTWLRRAGSAPGRLAGGNPRKTQLRATAAYTTSSPPRRRRTPERPLPVAARPDAVGCTNCVARRGERSELFLHVLPQTRHHLFLR